MKSPWAWRWDCSAGSPPNCICASSINSIYGGGARNACWVVKILSLESSPLSRCAAIVGDSYFTVHCWRRGVLHELHRRLYSPLNPRRVSIDLQFSDSERHLCRDHDQFHTSDISIHDLKAIGRCL